MNQKDYTRFIASTIKNAGGRAMLVGGCVRDKIMGYDPKDIDIECFNIEPHILREVLEAMCRCTNGTVDCVGESFKVYKVSWGKGAERIEFDISIPREDKKIGDGHKGFEVVGNPYASFEEAARRRDFTFNSIMQDALTGEIIDPFDGVKDLKSKHLCVVDPDHFGEDSLRVLRGIQFASRFNLESIDFESQLLMKKIELKDLPKERIWGEFEKLLLKSKNPSIGFTWAYELEVFNQLYPEFNLVLGPSEGNFIVNLTRELFIQMLDNAAEISKDLSKGERLSVMMTIISCFFLDPEKLFDFFGLYSVDGFNVRHEALALRKEFVDGKCTDDAYLRRMALRVKPYLFYYVLASYNQYKADCFKEAVNNLGVWDKKPEAFLQGRDLIAMGVKPGKVMGDILQTVFEKQLDGEVKNLEEAKAVAQSLI